MKSGYKSGVNSEFKASGTLPGTPTGGPQVVSLKSGETLSDSVKKRKSVFRNSGTLPGTLTGGLTEIWSQ